MLRKRPFAPLATSRHAQPAGRSRRRGQAGPQACSRSRLQSPPSSSRFPAPCRLCRPGERFSPSSEACWAWRPRCGSRWHLHSSMSPGALLRLRWDLPLWGWPMQASRALLRMRVSLGDPLTGGQSLMRAALRSLRFSAGMPGGSPFSRSAASWKLGSLEAARLDGMMAALLATMTSDPSWSWD